MPSAEAYVQELEDKNATSFQRLLAAYAETVRKEDFSPADILRLELKAIIEGTEVAALWLSETDSLELKLALATQCGAGARHFAAIRERLAALGVDPSSYDARFGGYSKLFAFMRSLQTTEERACAGPLTSRAFNVQRLEVLAVHCEGKGDAETARLLRDPLIRDERAHVDEGRRTLIELLGTEEAQARARRAAFRTIELGGEVYEGALLRKFLSRSLIKR
jgi:hypothetical protein